MRFINTDGMAFIGPGSEWFWTMLQFAALAITFYAIYRQLRGQQEQMRESTKLLRTQAHYNALMLHQRPEEMVIEIDGLARIVLDGLATPDALSDVAWFRFSNHMFLGFNAWEYTYYQHLDDSIPKELWVGTDVFYRDLVQTKPGCARFWSENQTCQSPSQAGCCHAEMAIDTGSSQPHRPMINHGRLEPSVPSDGRGRRPWPGSPTVTAEWKGMSMITFGRRLAAVVAASLLLLSIVGAAPAAASAPSWSHRDAHVCGQPGAGQARCTSVARAFYLDGHEYQARTESALAAAAAAAQATYYNGTSIRTAYGMTAQGDPSLVVAIVDANDDPNAFANVTRFRSDSGLPAIQSCTLAILTTLASSASNPCFTKTNQTGGTSLPSADAGWSNEIDLDLQAASAVCPMCSILLLEANSASIWNLGTAVTTASSTPHIVAISNSYGISGDYPGSFAPAFDNAAKKGIAVTASAGDGGYGVLFPASATNVIGVGGTTLSVDGTGVRTMETAWAGTGSGCSVFNAAPAWQSIPGNPCTGKKAVADLSADADPNSGLAIYTTYSGVTGYWVFGGTSLSSPIIAALYARQGGYNGSTLAGKYAWAAGTPYYDVTSGSNGTCSPSVLCTAGVGWDGPTGRGSIAAPSAPPVLTTITVSPASASVQTGGTQQFSATGKDQFGQPMSPQPTFTWSVTGDSTISSSGLVSAGATTGTFTVTATSGNVSGTASVTVTSTPPDFSLSVSPTAQSVRRGGTATYTVTITPANGFNGSVTLSLIGQPLGSTVTFTPNSATGTSTLTIRTLSTTSRQTYTMTISGVSGSLSHSTSASLAVTK